MQATSNKTGNGKPKAGNFRGQVLTIDFMLSIGVFLAAFYILFALWGIVQSVLLLNTEEVDMSKVVMSVSESLVLTPGQDSNWHALAKENASAFGLAWNSNVLQEEKVQEFMSLNATNYNSIKEKLGAGRYELYIFIDDLSGVRLYEFGIQPPDVSRKHALQSSQRFAILNGQIVILQVEAWNYIYT